MLILNFPTEFNIWLSHKVWRVPTKKGEVNMYLEIIKNLSVGRTPGLHPGGQEFKSPTVHQFPTGF